MSAGDGVDDREPEAGAAGRPRRVGPAEALEGVREEVGREAGALVADAERDRVAVARGLEPDGAAAVRERVVDEAAERLLEPVAIAVEGSAAE